MASTGAVYLTVSIASLPNGFVFKPLVFLPELGSAHLPGWHHSGICVHTAKTTLAELTASTLSVQSHHTQTYSEELAFINLLCVKF